MKYKLTLRLTFTILLVSSSLLTFGQADSDSTAAVAPAAIELINVSKETERVRQEVNRILSRIGSDSDIADIDSSYQKAREEFQTQQELYDLFRQGTPNKPKLNAQIQRWQSLLGTRNRWTSELSSVLNRTDISREMLLFEQQSWELTYSEASAQDAPKALLYSIENTSSVIDSALFAVERQRNFALTLIARITEEKEEISSIITDLQNWSSTGELNAFYKRHENIWETPPVLREDSERSELLQWSDQKKEWAAYVYGFAWNIRVFLISSVLMFAFIYYLRRKVAEVEIAENDPELTRVRNVVEFQPLAMSVYFSVMLAFLYLSNLPIALVEIAIVILLTTSSLLLRDFTRPQFKGLIWLILIAFILESLKSYVWYTSFGYRLFQYLQIVFVLMVTWRYALPISKLSDLKDGPFSKLFRVGVYLLIIASVVAFLANTFGYTNLSDIMLQIITTGAVISVIAYGVMFVLGGVIGTSLSVYFTQHTGIDSETASLIKERTQKIVRWVAIVIWILYILISAELYRPITQSLELWLTEPWVLGEFSLTPWNLLSFFLVIIVAFAITRVIALAVDGGVLGFLGVKQGVLSAVSMVVRYLIVGFAIAIALGALGVDLGKFSLLAGTLGVGLGFGLQNIVSNFISGMILMFERPIEPGDTIEVNTTMGVVTKIGVRSTVVRAFDGADVLIPNNTLLSNDLINWTRVDKKKRVEILIGAAYGTDPEKVRNILLDVARNHPMVLQTPAPVALFSAFGNSSLDFRLLAWAPVDVALATQSEVATAVYKKFEEEEIEIPFPRQDVTILNTDKESEND